MNSNNRPIKQSKHEIKAVLFDLDGVLIETEFETFKFYKTYLKKLGMYLQDSDFKYKAGRKSADFWNDVLTRTQKKQVDTEKLTRLKRRLFAENPRKYIKKVSGTKQLLNKLRKAGFRLGLATQNEQKMTTRVLNWLAITDFFEVILTLQNITRKKPDPEIYTLAAKKLKIKTEECVVVEDSQDGVYAAKNALMPCIAIQHSYTPVGHLEKADIQLQGIGEITPELIHLLSQNKRAG